MEDTGTIYNGINNGLLLYLLRWMRGLYGTNVRISTMSDGGGDHESIVGILI
jgi:hypothetical protein